MQLAGRVGLEYVTLAFADARGGDVGGRRRHREHLAAPGRQHRRDKQDRQYGRRPRLPSYLGPRGAGLPSS
jgi:hypothetical protein